MNDTTLHRAAHARLLAAELAEALDAPIANVEAEPAAGRPRGPRALALLAALLALSVTIWIATGAGGERAAAQDPDAFDALSPWHERFWPHVDQWVEVVQESDLRGEVPPALLLHTDLLDEGWARELLRSPGVRRLRLRQRLLPRAPKAAVDAELLRLVATAPDLEELMFDEVDELTPESLRELRGSTSLRHVTLLHSTQRVDADVARALAEVPALTGLHVLRHHVTPDAIDALANAPHLRHVALTHLTKDTERLGSSLAKLKQVRSLTVQRNDANDAAADFFVGRAGWTDLAFVRHMAQLQVLVVTDFPGGDADLGHLPAGLRSLDISSPGSLTPAAMRTLARLEHLGSLSLSSGSAEHLDALADVVRAVPLQRLQCLEPPTAALWQALAERRGLRDLRLRLATPEQDLVRIAAVRDLEHLEIRCDAALQPQWLQPLRELPRLRTVELHDGTNQVTARGDATPELLALRSCLGPDVTVR